MDNRNSYVCIRNFGINTKDVDSNPLSVCAVSGIDSGFNNKLGSNGILGPDSSQCQMFMGAYCGQHWDEVCELQSKDTQIGLPNSMASCNTNGNITGVPFTKGQLLIRNASSDRFLKYMSGNCTRDYELFDPTNPSSVLIGRWKPSTSGCNTTGNCTGDNVCIPVYDVDPASIDEDPVMNKLLDQPWIALDILVNIYNHRTRTNTMGQLYGTSLYKFFMSEYFQNIIKSKKYL